MQILSRTLLTIIREIIACQDPRELSCDNILDRQGLPRRSRWRADHPTCMVFRSHTEMLLSKSTVTPTFPLLDTAKDFTLLPGLPARRWRGFRRPSQTTANACASPAAGGAQPSEVLSACSCQHKPPGSMTMRVYGLTRAGLLAGDAVQVPALDHASHSSSEHLPDVALKAALLVEGSPGLVCLQVTLCRSQRLTMPSADAVSSSAPLLMSSAQRRLASCPRSTAWQRPLRVSHTIASSFPAHVFALQIS